MNVLQQVELGSEYLQEKEELINVLKGHRTLTLYANDILALSKQILGM